MKSSMPTPRGVGARVQRKEDHRHLHGRGQFVADIKLSRMRDGAFVRSPVAHGRIVSIGTPDGLSAGVDCWTAAELEPLVQPVIADAKHPDFKHSEYPVIAVGKVRFVGEPVAMVVADTRALAEDGADNVDVDIEAPSSCRRPSEDVPVVVDFETALH